jgi:uncharacterized protein YecE (DUF72 family)
MDRRIFIGTAGWNVPARHAAAFPPGGSHLQRYAARLPAVEINSSFYRPHRRATYERWAESVPQDFRFAVKVPRTITHRSALDSGDEALGRFLDEVGGLGEKLGVLLVQTPPRHRFDSLAARRFFAALSSWSIACEPRHPSWFTPQADALLESLRVARVAADPPPCAGAGEPGGWRGLSYFRLHGSPRIYHSDYDADTLRALQGRLEAERRTGRPVWCIFDNTADFHALGNALSVDAALHAAGDVSP